VFKRVLRRAKKVLKTSADKSRKETGADVGVLEEDVKELDMLASWRQMRGVGLDDVALALHAGVLEVDLQSKRDIVRPNTSDSESFVQALSRPQQWHTLPRHIMWPVLLLLCESMNLRHPREDSVVCKGISWQSCQS
jgi:hypothetical protein